MKDFYSPNTNFFVPHGNHGKMIKISIRDILYIEAMCNYSKIYCATSEHVVYISLKDIFQKLPNYFFTRIHKSYIINTLHLKAFEGNRVFLENSKELTIGRTYRESFYKAINEFILK